MTLLFRLAEWQALAKLRLHTELTLSQLDTATTALGRELCRFSRVTCAFYPTMELPGEVAARGRREARQKAKAGAPDEPVAPASSGSPVYTSPVTASPVTASKAPAKERKKKHFNLWTYKVHSLGDYVRTIRRFGTTDSYSLQIVRARPLT